jgi:hypothetical protein
MATAARGTDDIVISLYSEIPDETIAWLHRGYIPLGTLTVLDGDPGLGKSSVALDYAARVSRGAAMPDGSASDLDGPATAVVMSCEDNVGATLKQRLRAAGADLRRVAHLYGRRDRYGAIQLLALDQVPALEAVVRQYRARLLIVDPLMAYLPARVDSHRDQDIRKVLARLTALGEATRCAVLCIRHLNKGAGADRKSPVAAIYRGAASIGITGTARSSLLIGRDPDNPTQRVMASIKCNLEEPPPALGFALERVEVAPGHTVIRVAWQGATAHQADDLVTAPAEEYRHQAREVARDFLREQLAPGPARTKQVTQAAVELGIAPSTLHIVKRELGIVSRKHGVGDDGYWMWELPPPLPLR